MKRFLPMLLLTMLSLAMIGCSRPHQENLSVTEGAINWRSGEVDSLATDTMTTDSGNVVLHVPQLTLAHRNPFAVIGNTMEMYDQAPDSLLATDSLALARPELADSIRAEYSTMDKVKYVYGKSTENSFELLVDVFILVAALVLIFLALRIVYNVFIRSPYKD